MKKKIGILILVVVLAACAAGGFFIYRNVTESNRKASLYMQGLEAYQNGDLKQAEELLVQVGEDYEDSSSYLRDIRYREAEQLIAEEKYDEAEAIFQTMPDYKETPEYNKQITQHKVRTAMDSGEWDKAKELADTIPDYGEIPSWMSQIIFGQTIDLVDQAEFDKASELLRTIPDGAYQARAISIINYTQYAVDCVADIYNGRYPEGTVINDILDVRYCTQDYKNVELPLVMVYYNITNTDGVTGDMYSAYNGHEYYSSCH